MSLKEKINKIGIGLLGNRVTALGCALLTSSAASLELVDKFRPVDNNFYINYGPEMGLAFLGTVLLTHTEFGSKTVKLYDKTAKHIKKFDRIDKRFFDKIIPVNDITNNWDGYCQMQGVYLAARDYGKLDEFKEMRKKSSNVIPNF